MTPAGYRKYAPEDVSRLRFILAAQRDRYLPLRVIREHLAALDTVDGRPALVPVTGEPGEPDEPAELRLSREDLLTRAGIGDEDRLDGDGLLLRAGDDAPDLVCHGAGT